MLFSLPVFAVPGEYVYDEYGNKFCDFSDYDKLATELKKNFFEKYPNGNFSGNDYDKEVTSPLFKFLGEKQGKGHCGFSQL